MFLLKLIEPHEVVAGVPAALGSRREAFQVMIEDCIHPLTVDVTYSSPSYEVLDMAISGIEALPHEYRVYVRENVARAAITTYSEWASEQYKKVQSPKRHAFLDPRFTQ